MRSQSGAAISTNDGPLDRSCVSGRVAFGRVIVTIMKRIERIRLYPTERQEAASLRRATIGDLEAIRTIYNEGIEDRVATLDLDPKTAVEMNAWWAEHDERYAVLVAAGSECVVGWASLNRFSHRCAHANVADLSIYVGREHRGKGVGSALLSPLVEEARRGAFHKIVLHALDDNEQGKRLYRKCSFVEVGVFREHGVLDGRFVDVVAMERLL